MSPIEEMEIVERPDSYEPETLWATLAGFCESDDDLCALFEMYDAR